MSKEALVLALLVALLVALPPLAARAEGPYVQVFGCLAGLDGGVTTTRFGAEPVRVDFARDVDFAKALSYDARAGVIFGHHRLHAGGASWRHEAERSLRGFEFNGIRFDAEAQVENRLRWAEAEYAYAPIANERGRLELVAGVRWYDYLGVARGSIRTPFGSASSEESETAAGPVPHIGVAGVVMPGGPLVLRGGLRFFKGGVDNDEGSTFDFEAAVGARLAPWAEIGGGVRRFDIEVSLDDHETDIDLNYLGLVFYVRLGL